MEDCPREYRSMDAKCSPQLYVCKHGVSKVVHANLMSDFIGRGLAAVNYCDV